MSAPFIFYTRLNLVELLGRTACNLSELLEGIQASPGASIYYHTHRFLQQHHYLSPEPPNDFAFWVTQSLGLDALGEQLSSIDTIQFRSLKDLREAFVRILAGYLEGGNSQATACPLGEEFHFLSCRTFILPTNREARTPREFVEVLKTVSIDSLYFHMFESRLHLERGDNDFSVWFASLGLEKLAQALAQLDPYTITLEGLRKKIIGMVSAYAQD
jgi:hypothetical protein